MSFRHGFTLFCEAVRMEASGGDTLIGVIPGNIDLSNAPAGTTVSFPLNSYTRLFFDPNGPLPKDISTILRFNGTVIVENKIDPQILEQEYRLAREKELPDGAVNTRTLGPFITLQRQSGSIEMVVVIDGKEFLTGRMKISFV